MFDTNASHRPSGDSLARVTGAERERGSARRQRERFARAAEHSVRHLNETPFKRASLGVERLREDASLPDEQQMIFRKHAGAVGIEQASRRRAVDAPDVDTARVRARGHVVQEVLPVWEKVRIAVADVSGFEPRRRR